MTRLKNQDQVVIVGAGSIGLLTAYNLSRMSSLESLEIGITVIEAFRQPFAAASSTCSGCFHYAMDPQLKPLGKYSFSLWEKEARSSNFCDATEYRTQSCMGVAEGVSKQHDALPDWVYKQSTWDVDTHILGTQTATVNPVGLGRWLINKCCAMGVKIETGARVIHIGLSTNQEVETIRYLDESKNIVRLDCKQVLLACGPWTPGVYNFLFPSSEIQLESVIDAEDWVAYENPIPKSHSTTGFVSFASLAHQKIGFSGRNDGFIWAFGRSTITSMLPLPGQYGDPDNAIINEINRHARKYIKRVHLRNAQREESIRIVGTGRSFRSATRSGLPVISEVPGSILVSGSKGIGSSQAQKSGLFLCWGHGSYGLALGMGSGRLMSQLMLGENPDISISAFSVHNQCIYIQERLTKETMPLDMSWFV